MLKPIIKAVAVSAVVAVSFSSVAFAQGTAYVPFVVNVNATVTAEQGADVFTLPVTANQEGVLVLPRGVASVRDAAVTTGRLNAPAITGSRGNITLRLPAQSYGKAEVALHTVNGKRVLRGKADASQTSSVLSRRNVAAGVYMLSVKGANGGDFSTRLTHSGGKMNINVAFGAEGASPERRLEKQAAAEDGDWEITVAAGGLY